MRQLTYVMRFSGRATPGEEGSMHVKSTGLSNTFRTLIDDNGVQCTFTPEDSDAAYFESEVNMSGSSAFLEKGEITFGDGPHVLTFDTAQPGLLGPAADPAHTAGCIVWRITGGEGQFAGAAGYITSNFLISATGEVADHQFGVVFLP